MRNKTINITKQEAKLLAEVLAEGMPDNQARRDRLARIWFKLSEFSGK